MGEEGAESIMAKQESSFLQKVNLRKKLNSLSVINIRFLVLFCDFVDFCSWQVLSSEERLITGS